MGKLLPMREAIARYIRDGGSLYAAGFTHLISFAAAHEIIRQGRRDLILCRATPDVIYDQMIAAGAARKVVFSWAGNPGIGMLRAFRRAMEDGVPNRIELEEYTHFGMLARLHAGAAGLPFMPVRTNIGSDLPRHNRAIKTIANPYGEGEVSVVPALRVDVAIIHAQRADAQGNTQTWGIIGEQREAAYAAERVIVVAEEIVEPEMIRADPNRTLLPDFKVDAVVCEPWGAHPSYVQGFYDRDGDAYREYDEATVTPESTARYLREWIHDLPDRAAYVRKLGDARLRALRPEPLMSGVVDYGRYQ
jgi:glutaconate CoA-transferase subunit A